MNPSGDHLSSYMRIIEQASDLHDFEESIMFYHKRHGRE